MNKLILVVLAGGIPIALIAQNIADEIVITAPRTEHRVTPPTLTLDGAAINDRTPVAVADLFRMVPGIQMRVNSREETVIRLRGSEERQTGIFLDGAPLATPWEGRVDLALVPAGLISRISVVKGAAPLEYGPNTQFRHGQIGQFAMNEPTAPATSGSLGGAGLHVLMGV